MSLEDRRDRLGHKGPDFTTHYSGAEIGRLLEAARWNWPGQLGTDRSFSYHPDRLSLQVPVLLPSSTQILTSITASRSSAPASVTPEARSS